MVLSVVSGYDVAIVNHDIIKITYPYGYETAAHPCTLVVEACVSILVSHF